MKDRKRSKYRARWWQFWLPVCEHFWRPAAILFGKYPAKVCDDCGFYTEISRADFYAIFGTSFEALRNMAGKD